MKKLTNYFEISHAIPLISHIFAFSFNMYLHFCPEIPNTFNIALKLLTGEIKLPTGQHMTMVFATGDMSRVISEMRHLICDM